MDEQQLQDLIERHLDESASPQETAELQQILLSSDEACDLYWQTAEFHFQIRKALSGVSNEVQTQVAQPATDRSLAPQSTSDRALPSWTDAAYGFVSQYPILSSIAALLVVGIVLGSLAIIRMPEQQPPELAQPSGPARAPRVVAWLTGTIDATWKGDAPRGAEPAFMLGRKLELQSGLAEITYETGAQVVLKGPSTYLVATGNSGSLDVGQLAATVPAGARGFAVETPTATITDLGTEFGVTVDTGGDTSAFVSEGVVELKAKQNAGDEPPQRVTAGRGVRVTKDGKIQPLDADQAELAEQTKDIVRRIDQALGESHFELISIDWGKDAGSFRGPGPLGDGIWNNPTGGYPVASVTTPPLVDKTGATTRVTLTVNGDPKLSGDGNLAALGDPATKALLQDYRIWVQGKTAVFGGLLPRGRYHLALFGPLLTQKNTIANMTCTVKGTTKSTSATQPADLAAFVDGVSYVTFENVAADARGRITIKFGSDAHWFMGAQLAAVQEEAGGEK